MLVGYMRVSSEGDRQNTNLQRDALLSAGVDPRMSDVTPPLKRTEESTNVGKQKH